MPDFEERMKQPVVGPLFEADDTSEDHLSRWTIPQATAEASEGVTTERVDLDRVTTLHINEKVRLSPEDLEQIREFVGRNVTAKADSRSVWFDLAVPVSEYGGEQVRPVTQIQIKGVVFDEAAPLDVYGGFGWLDSYPVADADGLLSRFLSAPEALGYCKMSEAVGEFISCRTRYDEFNGTDLHFPMAIGWGSFEQGSFAGERLGYVILGLPDLVKGRTAPVLNALEEYRSTGAVAPVLDLIRMRGAAVGAMHRKGMPLPNRHFLNVSLTPEGEVFMHDLGDRRALLFEHMFNVNQFVAESFCNLAFILNPAYILVHGSPMADVAVTAATEHLDEFTRATLEGYFGVGSPLADFSFDEIEKVFYGAFEQPFSKLDDEFALAYQHQLEQWAQSL